MRYVIRSIKYLLLLSLLLVVLMWLSMLSYPEEANLELLPFIKGYMLSERGRWFMVGVVVLAALYPRFGFMRSKVEECDLERDAIRIDNAMHASGYRLIEDGKDVKVYRAEGIIHRLSLMFEDSIEVRRVEGGVEFVGIRRSVARIVFRLRTYLHNSRFEQE